ncbi:hypothetical protein F4782DRAFT_530323 [Xylaria castorea]|nr:hypothetical protein F4782DRAFT_530323 [Xylaria castorea]
MSSSIEETAVRIPDPIDLLTLLVKAGRNNPNQWVCEACFSTHEIKPMIAPAGNLDEYIFESCPMTIEQFGTCAYDSLGDRVDSRHRKFDHRHVELALKWTRLQDPDYKPMLDELMRRRHWMTTEVSTQVQMEIFTTSLEELMGSGPSPMNRGSLSSSFIKSVDNDVLRNRPESRFTCENCATDYTIVWEENWIDLTVWQDFGPETSPNNILWRSQCRDGLTPVLHEPGTVKRMYEELPAETFMGAPESNASSQASASSYAHASSHFNS